MSSMMTHNPQPLLLLLLLLLPQTQLVVVVHSLTGTYTNNHTAVPAVPCSPDQASALLRLKQSFAATNESSIAFRSWRAGTDCCRWEGVRCDAATGRAASLDLGDCGLESHRLDHALFELTSLRYLNLGGNDFNMSEIPSTGFERLTQLTHLNLSTSNFAGQVPYHNIGRLTNLVSLDLSFRYQHFEQYDLGNGFDVYSSYPRQLMPPNLTTLVSNLSSLKELHLSFVDLSNQREEWCNALVKYTPDLRILRLPFCKLSSPICASLASLHSLSVVDLRYNDLTGPFPEFFANSSLSVLQLGYNDLQGLISPAIFQHTKLVTLDLHSNLRISGSLPNFSADSIMETLHIGSTNFSGTIPSSLSNLKSLKKLGLSADGFSGELPPSIGKLRSLEVLRISGSGLVGSVPLWITNLTSLRTLQFSDCGLSGSIPSFIGDLIKLERLELFSCDFSGKIPTRISNLTQLQILYIFSNRFTGTVELAPFLKLPYIHDLDLSNNKLNMVVDGENNSSLLSSFSKLGSLRLSGCSISEFPHFLRYQDDINDLDLSRNQIQGAIPQWAWESWNTTFARLILEDNNFTSVGYGPFLPLHVEVLDLSQNMFEGPIPVPQGSATVINYSNNRFSSLPFNFGAHLSDVAYFMASGNKISGKIPASFCSSTSLTLLDLSYNNFSGPIPPCLTEDATALEVLNLKENKLYGQFPDNIKEGCSLEALDFSGNRIEGQLPRSLVACENLEVLDVGSNHISDSFPCWLSTVHRLQVLVLKSNKFFGQVAQSLAKEKDTCEFPGVRLVDLASNNFSGPLPQDQWFKKLKAMMVRDSNTTLVMDHDVPLQQPYKFTAAVTYKGVDVTFATILRTLVFIDVSDNAFHGSIPEAITELVLLCGINMSHNALTGPIPTQLGRLKQLESLDLSSNELSGEIPQELASLDFLATLNLSGNKLQGRIPESPHFLTFSNSSFLGNSELCGPPLSKQCSNETTPYLVPRHSENSADVMLFLFVGLGFGVGFAVVIIVGWVFPIRNTS